MAERHNPKPAQQRTRHKQRRSDEDVSLAPAPNPDLLRQPDVGTAHRAEAVASMQRAVGNAAVERALAQPAEAAPVQRKGAKKKKAPGTTTIGASQQAAYAIEAATLADAAAVIDGRGEAGVTQWSPQFTYAADANGVVTSATVTVGVTVTLPSWPGAQKLKPGARAEWDRFRSALAAHEQGHVGLVHQHMRGLGERLVGKTVEEALAAFEEAKQALQEASDAYDEQTDHGRNAGTTINTGTE